ncbi:MAG: 1-acyl-sn-glycerol-3-phosphate acyltransferase [Burkholderiales bacterium]
MTEAVPVPAWVLLLLTALAAWAAWEHAVLPGLRWLVTRPSNQVIDDVSKRLRIRIRPFQRTRRQILIHRLLGDPKVMQAAEEYTLKRGIPEAITLQMVEQYAREIVPAFNAYLYFRIGYWIGRRVAQALYRVRLGYVDSEGLAAIDPEATVVFVMNHRSNMDYILAGYLAADQAALSYAVGEWARLWPLSGLIRSMGAYFVRRNSKDDLYRRVLERYVAMATEAGVPQAVFPEGGLTRDGLIREPRLGVLDYMMRGFRLEGERDLVFVPLGINYDRVLEDRSLLLSVDSDSRKPAYARAVANTLAFLIRNFRLLMRSEWHRFGYACVNFGSPVSMRSYCAEHGIDFQKLSGDDRRREMGALGRHLMDAVSGIIPVVPVPLMATVFVRNPDRALSELELKAEVESLLLDFRAAKAHVYIPRKDLDYALSVGLRMLTMRRLVSADDGLYRTIAAEMPVLRYYANSIAHMV